MQVFYINIMQPLRQKTREQAKQQIITILKEKGNILQVDLGKIIPYDNRRISEAIADLCNEKLIVKKPIREGHVKTYKLIYAKPTTIQPSISVIAKICKSCNKLIHVGDEQVITDKSFTHLHCFK